MHPCHQDVFCQRAGNVGVEIDDKQHSAQLRASLCVTSLSFSLSVFPSLLSLSKSLMFLLADRSV